MSVNWVKARAACSIEQVFQILFEVVDSDIKEANGLGRRGVTFQMHTEPANKFVASRQRDLGGFSESVGVVFERSANTISIRKVTTLGPQEPFLTAVPALNDEGKCLLEVAGQPLELWQVSRRALEDLFFGF